MKESLLSLEVVKVVSAAVAFFPASAEEKKIPQNFYESYLVLTPNVTYNREASDFSHFWCFSLGRNHLYFHVLMFIPHRCYPVYFQG